MIQLKKYLAPAIVLTVIGLGALAYLTIKHYGLEALIALVGVVGVAAIIFAETGLLVGFFLPGDSLLFTAGFLVSQNIVEFNVHLLVLILFVAAVTGDSVGYAFGHRVGRKLFRKPDSLLFHKDNLRRAEEFYEKHGGKTIILARFIPVVRTFAPIIAGISAMHYAKFISYNVVGAALWTAGLTYLGFFVGDWIVETGVNVEYVILLIIFLSILPPAIHLLREPGTKRHLKNIVRELKQKYL